MSSARTSERVTGRNLQERMAALPSGRAAELELVVRCAGELGLRVAWVGGGVRDLLLGADHPDLDLVVESDPEPLARLLAASLDGVVTTHPRFSTASVVFGAGRIDLARARRERYPEPAGLPVVEPASLDEDLRRRDFTLNAMAVVLGIPAAGDVELLDPHGGARDLSRQRLVVLHPASFADDPSRILRGVGFELRFGFAMDATSEELARAAIARGWLALLSPARLWAALRRVLETPGSVAPALERLRSLGVAGRLLPTAADLGRMAERAGAVADGIEAQTAPRDSAAAIFLIVAACELTAAERADLRARLQLDARAAKLLLFAPERIEDAARILRSLPSPHRAAETLEALAPAEVAAVAGLGGQEAKDWVGRWRSDLRQRQPTLNATELLAAGVPAGPALGAALRAARRARLDRALAPGEELAVALAAANAESR